MRITRSKSFTATASITLLTSFVVAAADADAASLTGARHDGVLLVLPESRVGEDVPAATALQMHGNDADNSGYDAVYLQKQEDQNADETGLGSRTSDTDVMDTSTDRSDAEEAEEYPGLDDAAAHHSQHLRYDDNSAVLAPRDAATAMVTTTTTVPCSSASKSYEAQQKLQGSSSSSMTSMAMMTTMNTGDITATAEATTTICTPISWTNTFAFTMDAACPTPYEHGTYCGFVNPEDPCAKQPGGHGPRMNPDTPEVFLAYAPFHNASLRAAVPGGYRQTFVDLYAAANAPPLTYDAEGSSRNASTAPCYMGYHLLPAYDPAACAALCDADPSGACAAFNLYVERGPEWNPWRCSCGRPRAVTNYKCALFAGAEAVVDAGRATNFGQGIQGSDFVRKIAGSNGGGGQKGRELSGEGDGDDGGGGDWDYDDGCKRSGLFGWGVCGDHANSVASCCAGRRHGIVVHHDGCRRQTGFIGSTWSDLLHAGRFHGGIIVCE
ncbi:uncharacterized protein PG986_004001 [Apiospora aurea]|uniref:Uncharacterized protein n=1 Tax=Apiospora aurea TaxID=335848 RepID=A0ABR1QLC0_9PEZI